MTAPSCMNPLFAEMIERHTGFPVTKGESSGAVAVAAPNHGVHFPVNGSEDLSGSQEIGLTSKSTDRGSDAKLQNGGHVPSAQYLHYAILCLALLEENAILKQRLENQARVEAEMFPR